MPAFTYRGPEGTVYPTLTDEARTPVPGETYQLRRAPDGNWERAEDKPEKSTAKPAQPDEKKES